MAATEGAAEDELVAEAELLGTAEAVAVGVAVGAFVGDDVAPPPVQALATMAAAANIPTTRSRTGITGPLLLSA
jgi:hypothetical protein